MPYNEETVIQMWGDQGVGKTALLAAVLGNLHDRSSSLERINFARSQVKRWEDQYFSMARGILPASTSGGYDSAQLQTQLESTDGRKLVIKDIQGSIWEQMGDDQRLEFFSRPNQAFLFVVPWHLEKIGPAMNAVALAMEHLRRTETPCGLAVTKCEQLPRECWQGLKSLAGNEPNLKAWKDCPSDVARLLCQKHWPVIAHFLKTYSFWLTSAWGWRPLEGRKEVPALTLNEFGMRVPCHMKSEGVAGPFKFLINKMLG